MSDNPSSVLVQCSQYNFRQSAQPSGGLEHIPDALPPTRYSSTMPVGHDVYYDDPPHPVTGPAELQGNQSQHQFDFHRIPGITQHIPIPPDPPRLEQYPPAIFEVPNDHPHIHVPQLPLPYDIAEPSQRNPSIIQSEMSVDEDLKTLASRYLHSPSSFIDKLRMRRNRSGAVMVLILLKIDGQYAPANQAAIHEVPNDRPTIHAPPPHSTAGSSRGLGNPSTVHFGMSVGEDIKNIASHYLHNPSSFVDKLRVRRSRSGAFKVLILLEIDDIS